MGILTTTAIITQLLTAAPAPSPPTIAASQLARQVAPNAQAWRKQAEQATAELAKAQAEVKRLQRTQWRDFKATAYTADCAEGCTGITKTGFDVRKRTHIEGKRVIATDPSVIPMWTTVELRFVDGTTEQAIAIDTGGAIKGGRIDYLVGDNATALKFGRQSVSVRIIKYGG
ncbi:3D domain-containing protein [Heyndrickxia sporothermodurans]|uniref:3D domain-containing protein n=1 Tax=Heyndrickxia sporothermodurans TaxID=46224 RepID=UPI00399C7BBC